MDRSPWLQVRFPEEEDEETFLEQVLTPGDVSFLPAGTWHKARAIEYSLALTVACPPMTAADFVDDVIRGHLSSSVNWRSNRAACTHGGDSTGAVASGGPTLLRCSFVGAAGTRAVAARRDLWSTWTHHVASFDTPFKMDDRPVAEEVKVTDTLTLGHDFPLRYVARPSDGSVSLYYLNTRVDLAYEALPLVKAMLKRSSFPAHLATGWLGKEF